jgi:hypothetical protein
MNWLYNKNFNQSYIFKKIYLNIGTNMIFLLLFFSFKLESDSDILNIF